jgi:hypothetical protein
MDLCTHARGQSQGTFASDAHENNARPGTRMEGRLGERQQRADLLDLLIRELQLVRVETEH